jgi:hypothetical protein
MARTVVGYIKQYLNNMASTTATASVEALTGLPINTGLNVGAFQEFSNGEAAKWSYTAWGTLYEGTYMWVQLDPTVVTSPIPMGTAVSWLQSADVASGSAQVTTFNSTTNADFAGITIDSNFGAAFPYAFIQLNGKVAALFDATAGTAFGDVIGLSTGTQGAVTKQGTSSQAATGLTLGYSLVTTGVASARNLIRIVRAIARF